MSATFRNNANAGTNGAIVSYGASGGASSGMDWDFIYIGTDASLTYADQPARGSLSYKCTLGVTATEAKMEWQRFQSSPTVYVRFYVFLPSLPSGSFRFLEFSDGTQFAWSFGCRNDGKLSIRDSAGTSMNVSTLSLPTGRWLRLEAKVDAHGSVGGSTVKIFTEADSPYPAEIMTSANTYNTAPNGIGISLVRIGIIASGAANFTYYLDDIELNNTGYAGPANPSAVGDLYICNNADFGVNGIIATSENSSDNRNRFFQSFSQSGQISYSNAQFAHTPLSYRFDSVSNNNNYFVWRGLHTNAAALRVYGYFTALPGEITVIAQFASVASGFLQQAQIAIDTNGRMSVIDGSSTVIWQSPAGITLNTWYRFEIFAQLGGTATTGTIEAAYYVLDSLTAIASFSTAVANLGTDPIAWARFGKINATTYAAPFYLDSMGVVQNATGFIGIYTGSPWPTSNPSGIIPHLGWGREV